MDLNDYFHPVSIERPATRRLGIKDSFGGNIRIHTPDTPIKNPEHCDLALLGVGEDRGSGNKGASGAPDRIRSELYNLSRPGGKTNLLDLGNFKTGRTLQDTYFGLRDVIAYLLSENVCPVVVGGSQDLTYSMVQAYVLLKKEVHLVTVDSRLDFRKAGKELDSFTYLNGLVLKKNKSLVHYTNLGHQQHFLATGDLSALDKHHFVSYGLGQIRSGMRETEPTLRDADLVSIDISSVKQSDSPGYFLPSPNGFLGEEICQIARYAGLGNRISSFGVFEVNPSFDRNNQSSLLAAEMIWYFIDGYLKRVPEHPSPRSSDFTRYIVNLSQLGHKIVFYKSNNTDRWWMEIPSSGNRSGYLAACSYDDYISAGKQEIPDRWMKFFKKLN